jgi:hypothetical protein
VSITNGNVLAGVAALIETPAVLSSRLVVGRRDVMGAWERTELVCWKRLPCALLEKSVSTSVEGSQLISDRDQILSSLFGASVGTIYVKVTSVTGLAKGEFELLEVYG